MKSDTTKQEHVYVKSDTQRQVIGFCTNDESIELTLSRSLYTHRLYGSFANACWMASIAPGISASFNGEISTGILMAFFGGTAFASDLGPSDQWVPVVMKHVDRQRSFFQEWGFTFAIS